MTLPAHRFEDRKKKDKGHVVTFDFDETITQAPTRMARIAKGLKAQGDTIIVLTGNDAPRKDLLKRLEDEYEFPFDDLVQYDDSGTDGISRAEHLEQFGTWLGVDNRIDRCYTYARVCPHLYLVAKPTAEQEDDAKGTKKQAKKAAKKLNRGEQRGAAPPPPNLRVSDSTEDDQPEHECGTCRMFDEGRCWGYGNLEVDGEWVCDSWQQDPNWQEQDAEEDSADQDDAQDTKAP